MKIYKVVIIGDTLSGKTSLLYRYLPLDWRSHGKHHILGWDIETMHINMPKFNEKIRVDFWEIVGDHKSYSPKFFEKFYNKVNGIMLVFDVGNPKTFKNLSFWINQIKKYIDYEVPGILIGNKIDISPRKISSTQGQEYADKIGFGYIGTSAKQIINVKDAFDYIIKELMRIF
ncbi:MAG: Rab family GTPase [Candidatus Hodarchaeota archaeon]